jgi:type 1 glutamine amidotransferase
MTTTTLKITALVTATLTLLLSTAAPAQGEKEKPPVRALFVTGGHGFNQEQFHAMLKTMPDITFTEVKHPDAPAMLRPENRASYDVILLYDMPKTIGEQDKKDFMDCLKSGKGKGLVVWHHAYCSYQEWDEYANIIGGRYHEKPWTDGNGVRQPASAFKYNVNFRLKVADPKHPVTKGIKDFDIIDEAYRGGSVHPGVHVLLTTDEPASTPSVAWTNRYGKSKVVTILLGHDNTAWSNPNFKKLLTQAILWVK